MKPFDANLYANDDPAKHYVIEWLRAKGYEARVNPDQYGIDILASHSNRNIEIEIEVKHNWKGYLFPYRTVHISARKRKFFDRDKASLMMLNDDWSHALIFRAEAIRKAAIIIKDTIYTKSEEFIELPISGARLEQLR